MDAMKVSPYQAGKSTSRWVFLMIGAVSAFLTAVGTVACVGENDCTCTLPSGTVLQRGELADQQGRANPNGCVSCECRPDGAVRSDGGPMLLGLSNGTPCKSLGESGFMAGAAGTCEGGLPGKCLDSTGRALP